MTLTATPLSLFFSLRIPLFNSFLIMTWKKKISIRHQLISCRHTLLTAPNVRPNHSYLSLERIIHTVLLSIPTRGSVSAALTYLPLFPGFTPLHKATYYEFPDIVMALIDSGANVDLQSKEGKRVHTKTFEMWANALLMSFLRSVVLLRLLHKVIFFSVFFLRRSIEYGWSRFGQ